MARTVDPSMAGHLGLDLTSTCAGRGIRGAETRFDEMRELTRAAETAGFASVWVGDDPGHDDPEFEAFSLLGALATCTSSIALAMVPVALDTRAPSVMAKLMTCVDVVSGGRAIFTVSPDPADSAQATGEHHGRSDLLDEALEVTRLLMTGDPVTSKGYRWPLAGAVNRPPPVRGMGTPLVVSTDRVDVLRAVARRGDGLLVSGSLSDLRAAADVLADARDSVVSVRPAPGVLWRTGASFHPRGDHSDEHRSVLDLSDSVRCFEQVEEAKASGASGIVVTVASDRFESKPLTTLVSAAGRVLASIVDTVFDEID